jgi:hypothetical protein
LIFAALVVLGNLPFWFGITPQSLELYQASPHSMIGIFLSDFGTLALNDTVSVKFTAG